MLRRVVAEFLGTFAIVFFGCGAIASIGPNSGVTGLWTVNAVFGLTVAAMIYALGHISAAHFNPAVTLGFAVAKRFPWRYSGAYMSAQFGGALVASVLHNFLLPSQASAVNYGATIPHVGVGQAVVLEGLLTFFLMLVIISVATDRRVNGAVAGLAIGSTVTLCGIFGGPLTSCSMNPARSLAPALFGGSTSSLWIYFVGPCLGAMVAAIVYEAIRGGDHHGQGAPNDLFMALQHAVDDASRV